MRNKQKGFSLIELLIVVAIILIIAAIAIPNLIRSKIAANQASAVASLRTLNTASVLYMTNYNVWPPAYANLGPVVPPALPSAALADMIDATLVAAIPGSAGKSGYVFTFTSPGPNGLGYTILADPVNPGTSGTVHYYTDSSLVIHYNAAAAAGAGDPVIGQ